MKAITGWTRRAAALLVATGCLTVLASRARAQEEAPAFLEAGISHYRVGEFREALQDLEKAKSASADPALSAQVDLYRGIIFAITRHVDRAKQAFIAALTQDPTLAPPPGETKEAVEQLFQQVRAGLSGTLVVAAKRGDVVVRIDGKAVGRAPYSGIHSVGRHALEVGTADGKLHRQQEVVIARGKKLVVDADLLLPVPAVADAGVPGRDDPAAGGEGANLIGPAPDGTESLSGSEAKQTGRRWPLWTLAAAGLGLAAAGAAIGFGVASNAAYGEYESTRDPARYDALRGRVSTLETAANVSVVVAGALAVTSAVLYVLVDRPAARVEQQTTRAALGRPVVIWAF